MKAESRRPGQGIGSVCRPTRDSRSLTEISLETQPGPIVRMHWLRDSNWAEAAAMVPA